ncbi:uncharacterized protein LOC108668819 [Hyalella azteca]|uniref:Uncharacterized protein LOC108668819 n=1 Tax=Hyalella azteca TaxID=294128 RepID=A0A8B7NDH9_HYAAZ|nr:uncharacterized protein LOC108668819 [Hyalella azteca]
MAQFVKKWIVICAIICFKNNSIEAQENTLTMASTEPLASSLEEWATAFLSFLNDGNYNNPESSSQLSVRNLENLYRLLFVPEQRGEQQTVFGQPPSPNDVIKQLLDSGKLIQDDNGKVQFGQPPPSAAHK